MIRRFAVLALLVLAAASGCSRPAGRRPVKDTVYRHLESDPATLDPVVTNEEFGLRVEEMIFRPLVGIDRDRRFVPALATSWSASSDGLVYDFRLDPNARWEDGSPVTSADVAYTIDRIRDPRVPAVNWRWGFEDVTAVETPDAQSVLVRFRRPYAERILAFNVPIVAAASAAHPADANRKPFGTGPYRLESWEANQKITLVRRSDAGASAGFAKIVFRVIPDAAVRLRAGTRGELDEFKINRDQRAGAARSPEFTAANEIWKVPYPSITVLVWNFRNPMLADRRVRIALTHVWPRADAARQLYPPDGAALLTGPYLPGARENAPEIAPPAYDPALAGRLLDEAGYRRGADGVRRSGSRRLTFEVLYPAGYTMYANVAEILRGAYEKAGIELTQRAVDWAAYTQRIAAGEFDVEIGGTLYLPPKADLYSYYHSSQAPPNGENFGSYRNGEVDRAIEAAQREMEDGKRLEMYRQVHRLLVADPPADFLWSTDQYWGISKQLAGVQTSQYFGLFHFLPGPLAWVPATPVVKK
jgi:peptide/nickel transport system substrate-binding protein